MIKYSLCPVLLAVGPMDYPLAGYSRHPFGARSVAYCVPRLLWVVRLVSLSVYSRCCIRICSAMVGVPHRPLLPSLPATLGEESSDFSLFCVITTPVYKWEVQTHRFSLKVLRGTKKALYRPGWLQFPIFLVCFPGEN